MKRNTAPTRPIARTRQAHGQATDQVSARRFILRPLALAALLLTQGAQQPAHALPTGGQVVNGQVQISQPSNNSMLINQGSNKAIINWQGFGVGAQEQLNINQPNAQSVLLNRVVGYDPSYILGQMHANGRVFLLNPNGIVFGQNARVDVGSLVATTMHLSDTDFLAGRYLLTDQAGGRGDMAGRVINQGTINAPHGSVVLAGREVINSGQILAEGGRVGLIAATKVLVDVEGDGLLFFEVEGKEAGARLEQLGRIEANGGSVELMAQARGQFADTVLNMSGVVQARTLGVKQGRVVINGGDTGVTSVAGTVDATGAEAGQQGGDVTVTGQRVLLDSTALIDASGAAGGGQVRVGGGFHGADATVRNADMLTARQGSRIKANALASGNGGQVAIWSDSATRFFGQVDARGAGAAGQGGLVEVSGYQFLDYNGLVDVTAASGLTGTLLLDPTELTIVTTGNTNTAGAGTTGDPFVSNGAGSTLGWDTIKTSLATANTKVQTSTADIVIQNASGDLASSRNLTLQSAASIVQNSGATILNSGSGGVTLQSGAGGNVSLQANVTAGGGITVAGPTSLAGAVELKTATATSKIDLQGTVTGNGQNLTLTNAANTTDADAIKAGTINGVATLVVDGKATLGGNVTTTGSQTYTSATKLGSSAVELKTTGATAKISLQGAVDGNGQNLTLTNTANVTDADAFRTAVINGVAALVVDGKATLGGNVTTTGSQTYTSATKLGSSAVELKTTGATAKISLQSAVDGNGQNLTLTNTANTTDADAIKTGGVVAAVAALAANGKTTLGGDVTTSGTQTYAGAVTLAAAARLKASGVSLTSISAGANDLGLRADSVTLSGAATGTGTVTFEPLSDTGAISVAGGAPVAVGTLQLSQALMDKFSSFSTITLGSAANAYKIAVGDFNLPTNIAVRSSSGGLSFGALNNNFALSAQTTGSIDINNVVGGTTALTKLASLSLNGQIHINTGSITTSGNQSYTASSGSVSLAQNTLLDAGSGTITSSAIDGGTHDLTLKGGAAAGSISLAGVSNAGTLQVQGGATVGGDISTTGSQTYEQAVNLGAAAVELKTTGATAKIDLRGAVDGNGQNLTLTNTANTTDADAIKTGGAISNVATFKADGRSTLGGSVTSSGNQTYTQAVTLGGSAVELKTSGASARLDLQGTVDGNGQNLTLTNTANAADAAAIKTGGAITNVATFKADGRSTLGGNVTSSGSQTYTNTTTLGASAGAYTFTASALSFNGLAAGANDLNFRVNESLSVTGSLTGSGNVSIAGQTAGKTIAVGGATADATDLEIDGATLNLFGPSFASVTIGRSDGTAAINFSDYTLTRNLSVRNGSGNINFGSIDGAYALTAQTDGLITLGGNIGNFSQPTSLNFLGDVRFNNDFVFTAGSQAYHGTTTLGSNVQLNADGVRFYGTVDSATATARSLTINSPGAGVRFDGAVGGSHALASLSVNSAFTQVGADINTTVDQTYTGSVFLTGPATFRAPTLTFNNSLAAGTRALGLLTDNPLVVGGASGLGGSLSGTGDVQIGPYTNSTSIGVFGGVGDLQIDQTRIEQLTSAGFNSVTIGSATGTGDVTVGDSATASALTLPANLTLQSGTGDIKLQASVDGAHSLTLNTRGLTTIDAAMGSSTALTTLNTDAGGVGDQGTRLNASVRTTGAQRYGDKVVLGSNVSTTASSVEFADTVNSASGTNNGLTVNGGAQFGAAVGGTQRLGYVSVSGATQLGGDVRTTGGQTYSSGATLNTSLTLDSSGGYIYFPVGSVINGAFALSLNAGAIAYLYGAIGNTTPLDSLTVNGTAYLYGDATIRTSGAQTYSGNVVLYSNSAFTGTDIAFNGGLNGGSSGAYSATVNASGTTTLGGTVGSTALASLSTAHDTTINATSVTTTGAQTYGGDVVLGNSTTLGGNGITFNGTVQAATNGAQGLTLADAGTTTFGGDVGGGGKALASLTTQAGGSTLLPANVTTTGAQSYGDAVTLSASTVLSANGVSLNGLIGANHALTVHGPGALLFAGSISDLNSLLADGGGVTRFDGTNGLTTVGAQSYAGEVEILNGGDAVFGASTLNFGGGISGAHNLALSAGTLSVAGVLAGTGELNIAPTSAGASIDLGGGVADVSVNLSTASGFTQRTIGRTDGTGAVHAGALTLTGNTTIQSGSGNVQFASTVDGPYALAVNTSGATTFGGSVGATTALASLSTTGSAQFNGGQIRTTGAQSYGGVFAAAGPLGLSASTVNLHSASNLVFSELNLGAGGSVITDGVLTLAGNVYLGGGTLTLQAGATPSAVAFHDSEWAARNDLSVNNVALKEASAAIEQTGGVITTAAGSTLSLQAPNRGSIWVDHTQNDINGNLVAVSGPAGESSARFTGSGTVPVSFVRVDSNQIHAAGIEADAVKLSANSLNTVSGTKIRARLPFVNAQGTETSLPALTLAPKQPAVLNQFGSAASSSWIQVDVGDAGGGYLTVRPKGLGAGSSAIFLGGPDSPTPFYDGSGKTTELQVYYNGKTPSTPQEVGALSAVTAVIEESRRARFEETVRTENVSSRLRTGVIAEVGSGRPATEGTESIRMPQSCTPKNGLGC